MNAERIYSDPINAAASFLAHSTDLSKRFAWDDQCKRWRDRLTGQLVPTNRVFRIVRDLIHDALNAQDVPLEFRLVFAAPEDVDRLRAITSWACARADLHEAALSAWRLAEESKASDRARLESLLARDVRDASDHDRLQHLAQCRTAEARLRHLTPSPAPTLDPTRWVLPAAQRDRLRLCVTPDMVRQATITASWEDAFTYESPAKLDARTWLRALPAAPVGHPGVKAKDLFQAFCDAQAGTPDLSATAFGTLAIEVLCDGKADDPTRRVRRKDGWRYLGVKLPDSSSEADGDVAPVIPLRPAMGA